MTALHVPPLSEAQFQRRVIEMARWNGWMVHHVRPALRQSGRVSTPVQGHIGAPDLLLARDGTVIAAELKSDAGRLRPEQRQWLDHLGVHGCVWRPRDSDEVQARLARTVGA